MKWTRKSGGIPYVSTRFNLSMEIRRLTRDGTAELVLRDQIQRRERGEENIRFLCSVDHQQDWQPYPVDLTLAKYYDHTYMVIDTSPNITNSDGVGYVLPHHVSLTMADKSSCII